MRTIAKKWLNKQGDEYPEPKSLSLRDVSEAMGLTLQAKLPEGGVTSRLRDVSDYSSSAKKWLSAPPSIRQEWREVLNHNKSDVMAIYQMMLHMRSIEGA